VFCRFDEEKRETQYPFEASFWALTNRPLHLGLTPACFAHLIIVLLSFVNAIQVLCQDSSVLSLHGRCAGGLCHRQFSKVTSVPCVVPEASGDYIKYKQAFVVCFADRVVLMMGPESFLEVG